MVMDSEPTAQPPAPTVSVVTVCFNAAATLEQTIQSVLAQEGVRLEYIVIDGGSSDGSVPIIQRYAERLAYWCSERDRGIYHAMNKGLAQANGQWVTFLNADDYFHDATALRDLLQAAGDGIDLVAGGTLMRRNYADTLFVPSRRFGLCLQIPFMHTAALVRRQAMLQCGGFDERYRIAADCDLLFKVMDRRGSPWRRVERLVSVMRDGGASDRNYLRGRFEYMQMYWRHTRNAPAALLGYIVSVLAYLKAQVA
jgi:glycosyltransferase involved in cell wall biosynthesis